jgi:uncharacterized coiled-coil protein SlyX
MAKRLIDQLADANRALAEQHAWMEKCGGSLSGYIARYGRGEADPDKPVSQGGRYGLGGPLIYEADLGVLVAAQERIKDLETRIARHKT